MDNQYNKIRLYSAQAAPVISAMKKDGVCFSKAEYVSKKYGEISPIFLTAYAWFVKKAENIVPKPMGAQFPYWAFKDLYNVDNSGLGQVLTLDVPMDKAIFFDMYDWNKIIQLNYIGDSEKEEKDFKAQLFERGLNENKVMLTDFYPELKAEIINSWDKLFRHHEQIKSGDFSNVGSVQAGLWCLKNEWIY